MQLHRYVIERSLPGAGKLSAEQLHDVAAKSCDVLRSMGPSIQWVESYVVHDKVYCVYLAQDEEQIRRHAAAGGLPVDRVSRVCATIDPTTAN